MTDQGTAAERLQVAWRTWRRAFKAKLPYVRKREYRIVQRKYSALIDTFYSLRQATAAEVEVLKAPAAPLTGEVCLFVTFAAQPELKPHATAHIEALLGAGIQVVLLANAAVVGAASCRIDAALRQRLSAAYVRENVGFDFAAWAHGLQLCVGPEVSRLYLVNDSVIGPLDAQAFTAIVARVRASSADVVGLTENPRPLPHLQSFFLAFGPRALASPALRRFFRDMVALPTKDQVIDVYETRLTQYLRAAGLRAEALFPQIYPPSVNDVYYHWYALTRAGFPYVKVSVAHDFSADPRLRALLQGTAFRR